MTRLMDFSASVTWDPSMWDPAFGASLYESLRESLLRHLRTSQHKPALLGTDDFAAMAEHSPDELLDLLRGGTLQVSELTFAAEIAGQIPDPEAIVPELMQLLEHGEAVVREGALYGLANHMFPFVREAIKKVAQSDPSPGVCEAASEILSD